MVQEFVQVNEAIDLVVDRQGRPYEDDWDLIRAAELLSSEVARLRKIIQSQAIHREKRWKDDPNPYTQARLHQALETLQMMKVDFPATAAPTTASEKSE